VRRAIRAAGARLFFLPKYSPDLNPIEQLFAKLEHFLRKAAARTPDAVCNAIGRVLDFVTPQECRNDLANAGYAIIPLLESNHEERHGRCQDGGRDRSLASGKSR
jgi:hypothetical protein